MSEYRSAVSTSKYGLEVGTPDIQSVGSLAFGPEGIWFVADNVGATIFAIDVGDADAARGPGPQYADDEPHLENVKVDFNSPLGKYQHPITARTKRMIGSGENRTSNGRDRVPPSSTGAPISLDVPIDVSADSRIVDTFSVQPLA